MWYNGAMSKVKEGIDKLEKAYKELDEKGRKKVIIGVIIVLVVLLSVLSK